MHLLPIEIFAIQKNLKKWNLLSGGKYSQNIFIYKKTCIQTIKMLLKIKINKTYNKLKFYLCVCFLFFFNINLFILIGSKLLHNIVLVLPYINMNLPQVYTCSQSWTPLPPPSPYHPSGSSQCTSPKHPVSCIE